MVTKRLEPQLLRPSAAQAALLLYLLSLLLQSGGAVGSSSSNASCSELRALSHSASNGTCSNGFNFTKQSCQDVDECSTPQIAGAAVCANTSLCHNTFGSFLCVCKTGFRSEIVLSPSAPQPLSTSDCLSGNFSVAFTLQVLEWGSQCSNGSKQGLGFSNFSSHGSSANCSQEQDGEHQECSIVSITDVTDASRPMGLTISAKKLNQSLELTWLNNGSAQSEMTVISNGSNATSAWTYGTEHSIVLEHSESGVMSLRIDGQVMLSSGEGGLILSHDSVIKFGCSGDHFSGKVADFGVWNRLLTPIEVSSVGRRVSEFPTVDLVAAGSECVDMNECHMGLTTCPTRSTCANFDGGSECICDTGWNKSADGSCVNIDECGQSIDNCSPFAICSDTQGSFSCSCLLGFQQKSKGTVCEDVNECNEQIDICHEHAICGNLDGTYNCTCGDGYSGNGTYCFAGTGDVTCGHSDTAQYSCSCTNGTSTCRDRNECNDGADDCDVTARAKCSNSVGSFSCQCKTGWEGNGTHCSDIEECQTFGSDEEGNLTVALHNCHDSANCSNSLGSFVCVCHQGYSGNGVKCSDIDECKEGYSTCHAQAECSNSQGSFICTCQAGYTGNGSFCLKIDDQTTATHLMTTTTYPSAPTSTLLKETTTSLLEITSASSTSTPQQVTSPASNASATTTSQGVDTTIETSTSTTPMPSMPPTSLQVLSVFPSWCPLSGGVRIQISLANLNTSSIAVQFHNQTATLVLPAQEDIAVECPGRSTLGPVVSIIMEQASERSTVFDFVYRPDRVLVQPDSIGLSGGRIDLVLFGAPQPWPESCPLMLGDHVLNPVAVWYDSGYARVSIIAPPSASSAIVPLSIYCVGFVDRYLSYVEKPQVSEILFPQGECQGLQPCRVVLTITGYPAVVVSADQIQLNFSNLEFLGRAGSGDSSVRHRVQQHEGGILVLALDIPPSATPGNLSGYIQPRNLAANLTAFYGVFFEILIARPRLTISSVSSTLISANGGSLQTFVKGIPPSRTSMEINASIADLRVDTMVLFSSVLGYLLNVTLPAIPTGIQQLVFSHPESLGIGSISLLVSADGLEGSCSSGCETPLSGGVAVVSIRGFGGSVDASMLNASLGGLGVQVLGVAGNEALEVQVRIPSRATPRTANGILDLPLSVHSSQDIDRVVLVSFKYRVHPIATEARFSAQGDGLLIHFDQQVEHEGKNECSDVLNVSSSLGQNPQCVWQNGDSLLLTFGSGASFRPLDTLLLIGGLKSKGNLSDPGPEQLLVALRPTVAISPSIFISGASVVGPCHSLVLRVVASAARSLQFSWSALNHDPLDQYLKQVNTSYAEIPPSLLRPGEYHDIQVIATNFLGASASKSHRVQMTLLPVPIVDMQLPPPPYFRSSSVFVNAVAELPSCSETFGQVEFEWSLGNESDQQITTSSGPVLHIPPGGLSTGTFYKLSVEGYLGTLSSKAERLLYIEHQDLVAQIDGGDREVFVGNTRVQLEMTGSYDPDACPFGPRDCEDAKLRASWSCSMPDASPCLTTDSRLLDFPAEPAVFLDVTQLQTRGFDHVLISLELQKQTRTQATSVVLYLRTTRPLTALITTLQRSYDRISLSAKGVDEGVSLRWDVQRDGRSILMPSDIPSISVPTGIFKQTLVLNTLTSLFKLAVRPGDTFQVLLEVSSDSMTGSSRLHFEAPRPPRGGACRLLKSPIIGLSEPAVTECIQWSSDSLPIQYSFGISITILEKFIDGSDLQGVSWKSWTYLSRDESLLPVGQFSVGVRVRDAFGSSTISIAGSVSVTEDLGPLLAVNETLGQSAEDLQYDQIDTILEDLQLTSRYSDLIQISSLILGELIDPTQSFRSPTRRLLASSAAYRMRVRRLMLRRSSESTQSAVTPLSSFSAISAAQRLTNQPEEVDLLSGRRTVDMLQTSIRNLREDQIRQGGLTSSLETLDQLLRVSGQVATQSEVDSLVFQVLRTIAGVSSITGSTLIADEGSFVWKGVHLLIDIRRSPVYPESAAVVLSESTAEIEVRGSRSLPDLNGTPTLLGMMIRTPWPLGGVNAVSTGVAGVLVRDLVEQLPRPLSSDTLEGKPWICPTGSECVRVTLDALFPRSLVNTTGSAGRSSSTTKLRSDVIVACWRWDFSVWTGSNCSVEAVTVDGNGNGTVTCSCTIDGYFVVTASKLPPPLFYGVLLTLKRMIVHSENPLLYLLVAAATLAVIVPMGLLLMARAVIHRKFPEYTSSLYTPPFTWAMLSLDDNLLWDELGVGSFMHESNQEIACDFEWEDLTENDPIQSDEFARRSSSLPMSEGGLFLQSFRRAGLDKSPNTAFAYWWDWFGSKHELGLSLSRIDEHQDSGHYHTGSIGPTTPKSPNGHISVGHSPSERNGSGRAFFLPDTSIQKFNGNANLRMLVQEEPARAAKGSVLIPYHRPKREAGVSFPTVLTAELGVYTKDEAEKPNFTSFAAPKEQDQELSRLESRPEISNHLNGIKELHMSVQRMAIWPSATAGLRDADALQRRLSAEYERLSHHDTSNLPMSHRPKILVPDRTRMHGLISGTGTANVPIPLAKPIKENNQPNPIYYG